MTQTITINDFKARVKALLRTHPATTPDELRDYCDELIPPRLYSAMAWVVEETVAWRSFVVTQREASRRREGNIEGDLGDDAFDDDPHSETSD